MTSFNHPEREWNVGPSNTSAGTEFTENRPGSDNSDKHIQFSSSTSEKHQSQPDNGESAAHPPSVCTRSSVATFSSPQRNLRFASRRTLPSLSNTNIRDGYMEDWPTFSVGEEENHGQHDDNQQAVEETDACTKEDHSRSETAMSPQSDVPSENQPTTQQGQEAHTPDKESVDSLELDLSPTDLEKMDPNLQLYRYLKHKDLKQQISELSEREHLFVVRQAWSDALRLREIRNELIMLKNKNLYGNPDLNIDEEIRKSALKIIEEREALHKIRIKMSESLMYSDEAKDLWNQWAKEDDNLTKLETKATRDLFQSKLEDEWKNLAIRDKQRVSQLYDRVMQHSELQDEHKLAAAFRNANEHHREYEKHLEI